MNEISGKGIRIDIMQKAFDSTDTYGREKKFLFDPATWGGKPPSGTHTIDTVLKVIGNAGQANACTGHKEFDFSTRNTTQAINFTLEVPEVLRGKVHFLKITRNEPDDPRCVRVIYGNTALGTHGEKEFDEELPANTDWVRAEFSIKKSPPRVGFNVHVRHRKGAEDVTDIPCDPQAGNDPPEEKPDN
jgi:hypothetical protein